MTDRQMYYAPSTRGFYDSRINLVIPSDAAAISIAEYNAHMTAQSEGKVLVWEDGGLVQKDAPPPPVTMQLSMLEMSLTQRLMRDAMLRPDTIIAAGPYAGKTSMQAVVAIDAQIAALRATL